MGVINSTNWEETCPEVPAWIKHRPRWIKASLVTAAVNTRNTVRHIKRTGVAGADTWEKTPHSLDEECHDNGRRAA